MVHVLLAGESRDLIEVAEVLTQHGHHVTLVPRVESRVPAGVGAGHGAMLASPDGARERQVMLTTLRAERKPSQAVVQRPSGTPRRYAGGDRLTVAAGSVLRVLGGAVVLSSMHPDGAQVMIGILGPEDVLLPHSDDGCHVEAIAQTDVEAEVFAWSELSGHDLLASALALRVLRAEAWAAAQAHPHTEQRVLSILRLLAEQFGEGHQDGRLLSIRVTQGQLAAITGATRPTVSRVLTALRRKGKIRPLETTRGQRILVIGDLSGADDY